MTDGSPEERDHPPADAGDLPVVESSEVEDAEGDVDADTTPDRPTVAGLLLAAGTSSRFGERNKLLATVDGDPIVRHAARTLLDSGVDPVLVVLGHEADRVEAALDGLPVETVVNEQYETGQASSVRAGVLAVRERTPDADAVVVALGDMPFVRSETVDALVRAYGAGVGTALAAAFEGERGNPVLFDARYYDTLADTEGDTGGRAILLDGEDSALVAVDDSGVRRDVDIPGDVS
ncbi:NTP transferase domain-containing protein [Halomarina salina]|uniref:NTP transferase domain-containing protein n=1 Tax=Halomarina salina TaxID=1872699 RepID=A0ABD5RMX8_9EURY|nr:nucleotidyltransferase family protein [Halomarina salina]